MSKRNKRTDVNGILNINKPQGITSRDAVNALGRVLKGVKLGHAGTLDPLATGVLVVCAGSATRLIEYVQEMRKTYRTTVRLGATSDTLDADAKIVLTVDPRIPSEEEVRRAIALQTGAISQLPPQYSALKVDGRRAHEMARAGEKADLKEREIMVYRLDLLRYEWPRLDLEIECGSGTYIRSIARDVGERLGCGGLVEVLTRSRIGVFSIEDALELDRLNSENILNFLRPAADAVDALPKVGISSEEVAEIAQGKEIAVETQAFDADSQRDDSERERNGTRDVALIGPDGELVAIAEVEPKTGKARPRRVLVKTS